MSRTEIIFGPPGTGKTTALLDIVSQALSDGVEPSRIGFFTFTRKAANEAIARAIEKFGGSDEDFIWFRTLHGTAFALLGLGKADVMQTENYRAIGDRLGYDFEAVYDETVERVPYGGATGDKCLHLYSIARARQQGFRETWQQAGVQDLPWSVFKRFTDTLTQYKKDTGLLDFTDFLDHVHTAIPLDIMIIDEAQDLTRQQWAYARRIGKEAKRVVIAGDDDQAIFEWAGADIASFLRLRGAVRVLPRSYRLPSKVWNLATTVSGRIGVRRQKDWQPDREGGDIGYFTNVDQVPLAGDESWLLLCRNRWQLSRMVEVCRDQGVVYQKDGVWSNKTDAVRAVIAYEELRAGRSVPVRLANKVLKLIRGTEPLTGLSEDVTWADLPLQTAPPWYEILEGLGTEEREYIRRLRRGGESLSQPGRVVLSTIHGAKGGEADNVVIQTEMSKRVADGMRENPDAEHRVWYVAASRARKNVHIVTPRTRSSYVF